jgi:hypothetical protein
VRTTRLCRLLRRASAVDPECADRRAALAGRQNTMAQPISAQAIVQTRMVELTFVNDSQLAGSGS